MNGLLLLVLAVSPSVPDAGAAVPREPPLAAVVVPPPAPARWNEVFSTPESVLYVPETDTLFVSNIQGKPLEKDGNGYISRLSGDGRVLEAQFIAGGKKGVTLHAPKGMALVSGKLLVADIDVVRVFDAASGKRLQDVAIPGATFLNDLAAGPDGSVYLSDSGLKAGPAGFEPSGTDAVYVLDRRFRVRTLVKGEALMRPNGLLVVNGQLWVATFGAAQVQRYTLAGVKVDAVTLPSGSLDGLAAAGERIYVSSWDAKGIYALDARAPKAPTELYFKNLTAPADIAFDTRRSRVLVPRFLDHQVEGWTQ